LGKIKVLSEDLISLISAGEVIENPSSIVKELIENSLDAGTDMIDISIEGGGIDKIVVSDNGTGISREDCEICLQRHSTSKISTKDDIDAISTYGFRGEALASVAAVADVRITTQTKEGDVGTLIISRVDETPILSDSSRPLGTTVEVYDLFKKIPVRRKHLASPKVEGQRILEVVMKHAVIRTDVGFRLLRDEKVVIDCPPNQDPIDRITYLWGSDMAKGLVEVYYSDEGIWVQGFVAMPPITRGNRSREYFSVVRRPISDERLSKAVESAYSTMIMKGQYPVFALDIVMNPTEVDVNMHPTKREVRILDLEKVSLILTTAVRDALGVQKVEVESQSLEEFLDEDTSSGLTPRRDTTTPREAQQSETKVVPFVEQMTLKPLEEVEAEEIQVLGGVFKIIGQIHDLYILLEFEDGLLIVDQHAAHERVLYEDLRNSVNSSTVDVQELIEPFIISLNQNDAEQIVEMSAELEQLGYNVSEFGKNDISVSTLPEVFGRIASETELVSIVDQMLTLGKKEAKEAFMDELVKLTACHSAVRAGQSLSHEEIREIIVDLSKTKSRYNCCHGRPAMVKINKEDLDRAVGRMGPDAIARYRARHGM
jgi:DNA mismatch repair protein MutL